MAVYYPLKSEEHLMMKMKCVIEALFFSFKVFKIILEHTIDAVHAEAAK